MWSWNQLELQSSVDRGNLTIDYRLAVFAEVSISDSVENESHCLCLVHALNCSNNDKQT